MVRSSVAVWAMLFVGAVGFCDGLVAAEPPRMALLVGCTEYPLHPNLRELYGPAHDAPLWAMLLTDPKGFAFPKENVTQLVGWPKEMAQRPSYKNIVQAFERLIATAQKDSRIVIVLSGHGIQVPIPTSQKDPLDPKNPEPDGLDEVFLPADVEDWTEKKGLVNAITDNQVGAWLDRLREKGAHVLIVFDCCHSGTMTRGGPGEREINRVASPGELGISDKAVHDATQRAQQAVAAAKRAGRPIPGAEKVQEQSASGGGSLVAFYAAQPFEEAPELPFPEDAPLARENYYGMLSWTLVQTLKNRQGPLTYGELQRLVSVNYRASRGAKPPTPFAEGDLNREVLGLNVWPSRPTLYVERTKQGKLQLQGGELHGVTRGTILAIHPPPGDKRDAGTLLGYLKAITVGPTTASVAPVRKVEKAGVVTWEEAADAETIPDSARCEVFVRDIGDLRVKLFVADERVRQTIGKLDERAAQLVRLIPVENEADWQLRKVTPAQAESEYGLAGLSGERVVLTQGARDSNAKAAETIARAADNSSLPRLRKVFGVYSLDEKELAGNLERDLPKIFKWENLWRVAGNVSAADGGNTHGLALEVVKLKDEHDTRGERVRGGVLHDGDEIAFWGQNSGQHDLWASAFYLDANLAIRTVFSGGVGQGKRVKFGQGTMSIAGNSAGLEGLVIITIPQSIQRDAPNFRMLEQEPLKVADERLRAANDAPPGGFSDLLREAAFHTGTRGWEPRVSTNPAILSQSWVLVPRTGVIKP